MTDVRSELDRRYDEAKSTLPDVKVEPFESVPLSYQNEGTAGSIKHCVDYIRNNRGISYNNIGKKGKIVRKFTAFYIDPMVGAQNNIDAKFTTALLHLFKLYKERENLYNRINALEARICKLESEL